MTRDVRWANNDMMQREMQVKRMQEAEEKKQVIGLSPGHIGYGYHD